MCLIFIIKNNIQKLILLSELEWEVSPAKRVWNIVNLFQICCDNIWLVLKFTYAKYKLWKKS